MQCSSIDCRPVTVLSQQVGMHLKDDIEALKDFSLLFLAIKAG